MPSAKTDAYHRVLREVDSLIQGERDIISVMSTISCELYHAFDYFNWVGFYRRVDPRTLKVGPYQGTHGCLTIDIDRGLCGTCVRHASVQVENDVSKAPAHIACSSETKAEIVLPVFSGDGVVAAVLDIDSTSLDVFDETDITALQQVCEWVSARYGSGEIKAP